LTDLERYIQSEHADSPLIRIALVHYQFEAIHPFLDGNGRVGRILIAILLRRWGVMEYPVVDLSAYIVRHRTTYIDSLSRVSQRGDWRSWIEFFLTVVAEQGHDAVRRSRALIDLRQHYRQALRQESKAERLDVLIDHLFEHAAVTIRRASELLAVTYPTAQRLIERLAALGVLKEVTGKRRNRIYLATEVIDILTADRS
jgi:Fic family protein